MRPARRLPILSTVLLLATGMPGPALAQDPSFDAARASLAARVSRAIDAQVDRLAADPEAIRAWIHQAVVQRSYTGVLQGPLGAFLTRSANDVDQSLLLGLMLERSMVRYRYASCAGTSSGDDHPRPRFASLPPEQVAQAIAGAVTDPELRAAALALPGSLERLRSANDAAAGRLAGLLEEHAIEMPASVAGSSDADRHVWVQAASGTRWLDLDTTTGTGAPPCVADRTDISLSEDLAHRLRIELDVEYRRGDEIRITTPLSTELRLSTAALSPITFAFGAPESIGSRMGEILEGRAKYQPVLVIGEDVVTGTPIEIRATDGGAIGGLFGPDDDTVDELTGAWLRFTVEAPGGTQTQLVSEVVDRIGPAARDAGESATAPIADLAVVDDEYAAIDTIWQVAVATGPIALPNAATDLSLTLAPGGQTTAPIDAALRLYPSIVAGLGGDPVGVTLLLAGVMPILGDDGEPRTRVVLDALQVPGAVPSDRGAAARDAQAVVGAERALMELLGIEPTPLGDAASVFEAAETAGIPWTVLRPGDTPAIEGASPDTSARVARQLAAGNHVLTPSSVPAVASGRGTAWWSVDPDTGVVRDEHESGRHSEFAEYSNQNAQTVGYAERFRRFACSASRPIMLAATLWWFGSGFDPSAGALLDEVATAAEAAEANRRRGEEARQAACAGAGPG